MKKWILFLVICASTAHPCGIALVRLLKPLDYYQQTYGDDKWGLNKLAILMQRERHRGQDGIGIAVANLGHSNFYLDRDLSSEALLGRIDQAKQGQVLLGHLRYGTSGGHSLDYCQPLVSYAKNGTASFALAGNFNLTNTKELMENHGTPSTAPLCDTFAILETLAQHRKSSLKETVSAAAPLWDGGYVLGLVGVDGEVLVCRDPFGIRPGYYFHNEEVFAVASERFALMETFGISADAIQAIPPGHLIHITKEGAIEITPFGDVSDNRGCIFERIYFSKSNDPEIYQERKSLGRFLAPEVFKAIKGDLNNTVFTYVPNSSHPAFLGLIEGIGQLHQQQIALTIASQGSKQELNALLAMPLRQEIVVSKNQQLRTFISADETRAKLVSQLYEITQGTVRPTDTLVVVDDSIVRGATLREALLPKLIALNPKKIIIVSSAPPVMYPDCYGIDMSQLSRFIAFQAAVKIFEGKQGKQPTTLQELYEGCTLKQLSNAVAHMISPSNKEWEGRIEVIYQPLEGLRKSIPSVHGDWVFSGNYPTPGGASVLKTSFLNWLKRDESRSY